MQKFFLLVTLIVVTCYWRHFTAYVIDFRYKHTSLEKKLPISGFMYNTYIDIIIY